VWWSRSVCGFSTYPHRPLGDGRGKLKYLKHRSKVKCNTKCNYKCSCTITNIPCIVFACTEMKKCTPDTMQHFSIAVQWGASHSTCLRLLYLYFTFAFNSNHLEIIDHTHTGLQPRYSSPAGWVVFFTKITKNGLQSILAASALVSAVGPKGGFLV